jgi:hypothetical protein
MSCLEYTGGHRARGLGLVRFYRSTKVMYILYKYTGKIHGDYCIAMQVYNMELFSIAQLLSLHTNL